MPIESVSVEDFDQFGLPDDCRAFWEGSTEVTWYADEGRNVLGIVASNGESEWRFLICGKDENGQYQRLMQENGFISVGKAKAEMVRNMERIEQ